MKLSDILWLISEIPAEKRNSYLNHMNDNIGDVKAWHITSAPNAPKIREQGIKAQSSRQSYDRPSAVYFFIDKNEVDNESKAILLDDPNDAAIIEVTIPRDEFLSKSRWDGLHNVSFGTRSAIQFFGDIPSDWIS